MGEEGADQITLPLLSSNPLNGHGRPDIRYASIQMPTMNSNDELLLRGESLVNRRRWSLTTMAFSAASMVALTTFLILALLLFVLAPEILTSGTFQSFTYSQLLPGKGCEKLSKVLKHRKNCECCPCHSLFKGHCEC